MKVLQTFALPLGHDTIWSGLRGSNSLPSPWQGGALPDELKPHIVVTLSMKQPVGRSPQRSIIISQSIVNVNLFYTIYMILYKVRQFFNSSAHFIVAINNINKVIVRCADTLLAGALFQPTNSLMISSFYADTLCNSEAAKCSSSSFFLMHVVL